MEGRLGGEAVVHLELQNLLPYQSREGVRRHMLIAERDPQRADR